MSLTLMVSICWNLQSQEPFFHKLQFNLPGGEQAIFNTAMQDKQGFIWLGSDNGLFRFDGLNFRHYALPSDSSAVKVLSIHQDPDGLLWIGCNNGQIFHLVDHSLALFNPEEGTSGKGISDITTDANGVTWWSTLGEGIFFYDKGRVYNIDHEDGLKEDYVYDLLEDEQGHMLAGTDGGVAVCSQQEGRKTVEIPPWNVDLPDPIVKVLKRYNSREIFLALYESAPCIISSDAAELKALKNVARWQYGPVSDMEVLGDEVWIATTSGHLVEVRTDGISEIGLPAKPESNHGHLGKIYRLLKDMEGNVWILTSSGIYRSTGNRLRFFHRCGPVELKNIQAVSMDKRVDNSIWFASEEGLFRADLEMGTLKKYLEKQAFENLKVTSLCQDTSGFLWAGTFNYGVLRINPDDGNWTRITEKEGLVNDNVLSISAHDDTLWLATLGGASRIILGPAAANGIRSIRTFNRSNGLVSNYIYSVFEDKDNRIWFATDGDGVSVMEQGSFRSYSHKDGLEDDVIYSISGDHYGNIWIATATAGIYQFTDSHFKHFGIDEGLSSMQIAGLKTTGDEAVVILENGLDIIHIPSGRIIHLGEEAGLADISPDLNTVSTDMAGNLWIGTRKGIICYQRASDESLTGPRTILEEVAVFLEPVEMKEDLVLNYRQNHISFTYAGLWMSNPEKVNFQVMLEGYDLGWKSTYDRMALYSSLPPGKYTFRVRSSMNRSFLNASEASFGFRIRNPLWGNVWFIITAILLASLFIYLMMRARERKLMRIEQEKKAKVEFEFQLLKNQVNPHFLFNSFSTLMALIEEQPRQALEYTEKLSDFFRTILQLKDVDLIPMAEELRFLKDYFFLLEKRYGDSLELEIRIQDEVMESPIPPMTLQILIENAVKHNIISKVKPLKIRIYSTASEIVAENNVQPKKSPEVSTGIGLENIFKRYRLKTGKEPEIEKSTEYFRVKLPILTPPHNQYSMTGNEK